MSDAHTIHHSEAPSHRPAPGSTTTAKNEVQAKQGTDTPKSMPRVLIISMLGAVAALCMIWLFFMGPS